MAPPSNVIQVPMHLAATARSFIPPSAPSSMMTAASKRNGNATLPRSSMADPNEPSPTQGGNNEATSIHIPQLSYIGTSGCSLPRSLIIDAGLSTRQGYPELSSAAGDSRPASQYVPGKQVSSNGNAPQLSIPNFARHATQSRRQPIHQSSNPNSSANYHQTAMYHQESSSPPARLHYRPANATAIAQVKPSHVAEIIGESHVRWMSNRSRDSDGPVPTGSQHLLRCGVPHLQKSLLPYEGSDDAAAAQINFLQHALRVAFNDLRKLENELAERKSKENGDEEHCLNVLAQKAAGLFPVVVKEIQHLEEEIKLRDNKLHAWQKIYNIPEDEMSIEPKEDVEQEQHRQWLRQAVRKVADVRNLNPPSETQRKRDEMQKAVHGIYRARKETEFAAGMSQYIKPGTAPPSPPRSPGDNLTANLAPI